ncbi:MAG: outer membrane protein assembly factor BamD [candidate division WOR-3 bacterium]
MNNLKVRVIIKNMKIKKKKKLTKKELKKDPFIEFVNNIYEKFKEKPREYIGSILLIIAVIFLIFILRTGEVEDFPIARQMWFQAVSLMQAQRMNEAIQIFQDISIRFPNSPEGKKAIFYLANFAFLQEDYVTAKTRYESYLSKKPNDPLLEASANEALAIIDFNMGNIEGGKKRLKEAIRKTPYKTFKSYFAYRFVKLLIDKELYKEAYEILNEFKDEISEEFKADFVRFESFLKGVLEL